MTQRFFYDTEFLEGSQKRRIFGFELPSVFDTHKTIDLISIGIVSEDGNREYYAISKDFNLKEVWNRYDLVDANDVNGDLVKNIKKEYWIRENVLKPIYKELHDKENLYARQALFRANVYIPETKYDFTYKNIKRLINKYGKTNKQIAKEVETFIGSKNTISNFDEINLKTEIYAYYSAYDHVVLSWLYGKMINLPKGFPQYTIDLKQELDRKVCELYFTRAKSISDIKKFKGEEDFESCLKLVKCEKDYPKQTIEHNALSDAKFNRELYLFLKNL